MRRWLYGLWLLLASIGWTQWATVHLQLADRGLNLQPAPVWESEECWLPVMHTAQLSLQVKLVSNAQYACLQLPVPTAISVKEESGSPDTDSADPPPRESKPTASIDEVLVPVRFLRLPDADGKPTQVPCVPLRQLIQLAGGATDWDHEKHVLTIRAKLKIVELWDNRLQVETTLPVRSVLRYLKEPERLVVDLIGCQLPDTVPQPTGEHSQVEKVRLGQFDPQTVRVVCDLRTPMTVVTSSGIYGTQHLVALTPGTQLKIVAEPQPETPPDPIGAPIVEKREQGVLVRLPTSRPMKPRLQFLEHPPRVAIDLPGGELAQAIEQTFEEADSPIKAIRVQPLENPTGKVVRVVLELGRALGVNVQTRQNELAVVLNIPRNAGGKLSEKIITIDPGHGGSAAGARITKGGKTYREKDITLSTALKVAQKLSRAGATVIMTRAEDADIGLYERTKMSNQSGAHFFISLHCDSNNRPNSVSGATVYYHGDDADSRALAQAILEEIVKVSGLPSKGVRSDKTLYQTGLAVLRTSEMPAVLIEMGYLNHDGDRAKLLDPKFQDAIADAIVRGVQKYIGER